MVIETLGNSKPVKDFPLTRFGCYCLGAGAALASLSIGIGLAVLVLDSEVPRFDTAGSGFYDHPVNVQDTQDTGYIDSVEENSHLGGELLGVYSRLSSLDACFYDSRDILVCIE